MARFLVIASGKGGVGKTTTALNLGTALSNFGREVIVLDANMSTANIGLHLGAPNVPVTLNDVFEGKKNIKEAAFLHPSGLKIILSSIALEKYKESHSDMLKKVMEELKDASEVVIIDTAAGLGKEVKCALSCADEVIIVTTPDLPSVTDTLKTIKIAEKQGSKIIGVVVNRVNNDNLEMTLKNVETILEKPIIGIIPQDLSVRKSLYLKNPVNYTHPHSKAAVAYKKLAAKLIGEKYVESVEEKESIHKYLLRRLGLL
ncbi:AAA family ATPase [Candidatus Woesearchaeota archaeon]|nr:AAA family ATPase [Candidatus Woesearchaeota archaeon]